MNRLLIGFAYCKNCRCLLSQTDIDYIKKTNVEQHCSNCSLSMRMKEHGNNLKDLKLIK